MTTADAQRLIGEALEEPVGYGVIVGVRSDARVQGIGRSLMQACEEDLKRTGHKHIIVRARQPDAPDRMSSYQYCRLNGYRHSRYDPLFLVRRLVPEKLPEGEPTAGGASAAPAMISPQLKDALIAVYRAGQNDSSAYVMGPTDPRVDVKTHEYVYSSKLRSRLSTLPWAELEASHRAGPKKSSELLGIPGPYLDVVLCTYIHNMSLQNGVDPKEVLKPPFGPLPSDPETVQRLLEDVKSSGQVEYNTPASGLLIITFLRPTMIPDPREQFATAEERFGNNFFIAGATVWENQIVKPRGRFGLLWRPFLALYKRMHPNDLSWMSVNMDVVRSHQKLLEDISLHNTRRESVRFLYDKVPPYERALGPQAFLYHYDDHSFLIPSYITNAQGEIIRGALPVYLVDRPLHINPLGEDEFEVQVRPLTAEDTGKVKKILRTAPRSKISMNPIDRGVDRTLSGWWQMVSHPMQQFDKDRMDGYILREIEIFIANKTAGEIEDLRILDDGCGDGTLRNRIRTLIALKRPEVDVDKMQIQGVESDPVLREVAQSQGMPVLAEDARTLPFPDNSFDIVIAAGLLIRKVFEPDQAAVALSEMQRVLRPVPSAFIIQTQPPTPGMPSEEQSAQRVIELSL